MIIMLRNIDVKELEKCPDCFPYMDSPKITWINVDGLRKKMLNRSAIIMAYII